MGDGRDRDDTRRKGALTAQGWRQKPAAAHEHPAASDHGSDTDRPQRPRASKESHAVRVVVIRGVHQDGRSHFVVTFGVAPGGRRRPIQHRTPALTCDAADAPEGIRTPGLLIRRQRHTVQTSLRVHPACSAGAETVHRMRPRPGRSYFVVTCPGQPPPTGWPQPGPPILPLHRYKKAPRPRSVLGSHRFRHLCA